MFISVFRGGFTREAAREVAGASLKQLARLVNKSFISYNLTSGRYEIHELLRQYAQDRLESTPEASDSAHEAHATYFAKFMSLRWPLLRSSNQLAALREIEEETGLVCTFVSLLGVVNERARIESAEKLGGAHFLLFVCLVDSMNGKAEEREEGAVAWFSLEDIEQLNDSEEIIPSDYAMLSHFLGEAALPYVEAEMVSTSVNDANLETTNLIRFEVIK